MIKINKPKAISSVLNDKKAEIEFKRNIVAKKHVGENIYKDVNYVVQS